MERSISCSLPALPVMDLLHLTMSRFKKILTKPDCLLSSANNPRQGVLSIRLNRRFRCCSNHHQALTRPCVV